MAAETLVLEGRDGQGNPVTKTLAVPLQDTVPTATPLVGRSTSDDDPGPLLQCDLGRVYKFAAVDGYLAESGAKMLFLSDDPGVSTASQLDAKLDAMFTRHPDLQVIWLPANEITGSNAPTGSAATAYVEKTRSQRTATDHYPQCQMGVNLTAFGVRTGRHLPIAGVAEFLQAITSSCYNPGRTKTPPVWDPYPNYMADILDVVEDWGHLPFGMGEFGSPISPTDPNKRPSYFGGLLRWTRAECAVRGIPFLGGSYWNAQKNEAGAPNNRLLTDNPLTANAVKTAFA